MKWLQSKRRRAAWTGSAPGYLLCALLVGALWSATPGVQAQIAVGISVNLAPPALPVYVQPPCPEPNFLWTPGFWAWDPGAGFYWVPGTWVAAPQPGYLWTPGYWGWEGGGLYVFHPGYWGREVGFYGGVNYGFGYGGRGFAGGEWRGGVFAYNTAAVNVNTTVIRNTYVNTTVVHEKTLANPGHTSFNGGPNGVAARPTAREQAFAAQPHLPATPAQREHDQVAKQDRANFAATNHGVPAHAAVLRPASNVAALEHTAVAAKAAPGAKPFAVPPARASAAASSAESARPAGSPGGAPAATRPGQPGRFNEHESAAPRSATAPHEATLPRPVSVAPRPTGPSPAAAPHAAPPPRAKEAPAERRPAPEERERR